MRMNVTVRARGDQQVMLPRTWRDEQNVARRERRVGFCEVALAQRRKSGFDRAVAEAIVLRRPRPASGLLQRDRHQPDAIEPECGIAAMQPKLRAEQALGRGSDALPGRHGGDG